METIALSFGAVACFILAAICVIVAFANWFESPYGNSHLGWFGAGMCAFIGFATCLVLL